MENGQFSKVVILPNLRTLNKVSNIKQGDSVELRNHLWDYKNINLLFYFLHFAFNYLQIISQYFKT